MDRGLDCLVAGAGREMAAGLMSAIGRLNAISSDALLARRERQKKYLVLLIYGLCLVMFSRRLGQLEGAAPAVVPLLRIALCLSAGNYGLLRRERQFELVRNTAVGLRKTTVGGRVSVLNREKMG
jgi:hypothetical protein